MGLFDEVESILSQDTKKNQKETVEVVSEPLKQGLKTRTRYKIVGSDFSAQEPRLTAFMSQDPAMLKAYQEGQDLYCVIAASMFNNKYEDNLEFYPAGTEIELDGKKVICGDGAEPKEVEFNINEYLELPIHKILQLNSGKECLVADLHIGDTLDNGLKIIDINKDSKKSFKLLFSY